MKNFDAYVISVLFMIFIAIGFNSLVVMQEEKTRLEIEKLKYELSIYKELEESVE